VSYWHPTIFFKNHLTASAKKSLKERKMIQKILLVVIFSILSAITNSAIAQTEVDWRLIIQDDEPVLMKEALMTKVTNEAALFGAEKVFAASANEDGILPLNRRHVETHMTHLFKSENTFIAAEWLAYDKLKNFVELKKGQHTFYTHWFNPVYLFWMIAFFSLTVNACLLTIHPEHRKYNICDASDVIDISGAILLTTWTLFIVSALFVNWLNSLLIILLAFFLMKYEEKLSHSQANISWYSILLISLVIVSM
jgi:hypothetical protein